MRSDEESRSVKIELFPLLVAQSIKREFLRSVTFLQQAPIDAAGRDQFTRPQNARCDPPESQTVGERVSRSHSRLSFSAPPSSPRIEVPETQPDEAPLGREPPRMHGPGVLAFGILKRLREINS